MPATIDSFKPRKYLKPRCWSIWLLLGLLWSLSRFTLKAQFWFGKWIGIFLYHFMRKRRRVTRINIERCFGDKTAADKKHLVRQAFRHFGVGLVEMGSTWFRHYDFFLPHVKFEGVEYLHQAKRQGRGVILFGAHFTALELGTIMLSSQVAIDATYDPPKNPMFSAFLLSRRLRYIEHMIDNRNMRRMVRRLREGGIVWYSPDQYIAEEHGGMVGHFFKQEVLTVGGTARMAKMTQAIVVPLLTTRCLERQCYNIKLFAPLTDFPSDSLQADTQRINDIFEDHIRAHPEQYFWLHKRFKPVNHNTPDPYQ